MLHVTAEDAHWRSELRRAAPMLQRRLAELLGDGVVKKVTISRVQTAARHQNSAANTGATMRTSRATASRLCVQKLASQYRREIASNTNNWDW